MLADRIVERDPDDKPKPGDPMKFVLINDKPKALMGEKIETPEFIIQNNLSLLFAYYKSIDETITTIVWVGIREYGLCRIRSLLLKRIKKM